MTLKSNTLKLASLLAQFLFSHKRLDLHGIGIFTIDYSINVDNETGRHQSPTQTAQVQFQSDPSVKESPELIAFISSQTGKMKALAAADLNSHVDLIREFLNIGKPFLLEGIGSLIKIRSGHYEFTPGVMLPEKINEPGHRENSAEHGPDESSKAYRPFLEKSKNKNTWSKPVLALLILVGVGLAVLGGYVVYKRNSHANTPTKLDETTSALVAKNIAVSQPDSIPDKPEVPAVHANKFKYILETAGRKRAFYRYSKLKEYRWKVQMETNDSIKYKIFMLLPSIAMDTSKVRDSLTVLNGRTVYIEYE